MQTLSGHAKNSKVDLTRLQGITDPTVYRAEYHKAIRENLQSGGFLPPAEGLTTPVQDADDTGSFFKDTVNKITNYAGVKAFDTKGESYEKNRFNFITAEEGYRDGVYRDSRGLRTIGYGFNLDDPNNFAMAGKVLNLSPKQMSAIRNGRQNITVRQAQVLFEASVGQAENVINTRLKGVPLRANQRMALVSMAYNSPSLIGPKITKALKEGNGEAVMHEILNNSNRRKIRGLQKRREREASMFTGHSKETPNLSEMFGISTANAATMTPAKRPPILPSQDNADDLLDPEAFAIEQAKAITYANTKVSFQGQDVFKANGEKVVGTEHAGAAHMRMFLNDMYHSAHRRNAQTNSDMVDGILKQPERKTLIDFDQTTYDASYFSGPELSALYSVIGRSARRLGNTRKGYVTYTNDDKKGPDDYEKGMRDVAWSSNELNLTGGDSEAVMKKTLGQFSWEVNKQGELIVTDRYNFNDGEKIQAKHNTDSAKALQFMKILGAWATRKDVGWYGVVRGYAALYGSREGEGASFKINLGKVDLGKVVGKRRSKPNR